MFTDRHFTYVRVHVSL